MAFEFNTESQQEIPDMAPPKERISRFHILVLLAFGMLVTILLSWGSISAAVRTALARRNAKEAREAIATQDWNRAYQSLALARQRAPEDIEVIRAMVAFYQATGSDPSGLAQQLRLLAAQQPLTEEEDLLLGRSLIASGKTTEARGVYEKMPLGNSTHKPGLELLSSILTAEGHTKEAAEITRRASSQTTDSPETHLEAALEDLKSTFVEVRQHARKQLWQLADLNTKVALEAIAILASDPAVTLAEAKRLLDQVGRHPLENLPARLGVISALMRLQPDRRTQIVTEEIARFQTRNEGGLEELAYWLMTEKQNEEIFKLIPRQLAMNSRELYPILMQALAQAKRWEELKELLMTPRPPVSKSLVNLALAEVQSQLQPDLRETRLLLQGTLESARLESSDATLHTVASLAEKLNLTDIAIIAYKDAGDKAAAAGKLEDAVQHLQKAVAMALLAKDSTMLLAVSRKLHEMRPSSAVFSDRLIYLRLILGVEMETIDLSKLGDFSGQQAAFTITLERIPPQLLLALAAYRLGDAEAVAKHLADLKDAAGLPAGQRAVAAGLLSLAGRQDRAYQIAEKVPDTLLLNEERAFLQRAR